MFAHAAVTFNTPMHILKPYCFVLLMLAVCITADAQQSWLNGYLKDSLTHFAIGNGQVTNTRTRKVATASGGGLFRIQVQPGDVLYATAKNYRFDTIRYQYMFADTITLYLSPAAALLPGVTVTSTYSRYQLDSMERRENFEKLRGQQLNTIAKNHAGFGITLNLDNLFKKENKNDRKAMRRFEATERWAYVQHRFAPQLVAQYTGLTGDALRDFIYRYTPSYDWLRSHPTNNDILFYINEKLKLFKKTFVDKKSR